MQRETKIRLIKHIEFLESEIEDYHKFKTLTWEEYNKDKDKRRNVERWVENIINSSVDISKIILSIEKIAIPDTYKEIINKLSLILTFDKDDIEKISDCVRLRNIIIHDYLVLVAKLNF